MASFVLLFISLFCGNAGKIKKRETENDKEKKLNFITNQIIREVFFNFFFGNLDVASVVDVF